MEEGFMKNHVETVDYCKHYANVLQENLVFPVHPNESEDKIGLELFERYAEIYVLLLKFYKQEFTYEQAHTYSKAIYLKYRESSGTIDLTCQYKNRMDEIVKLIADDNPDQDGIEFLQNWGAPEVWQHYKEVYGQLACEWSLFKSNYPTIVKQYNENSLYKTIYNALDKFSDIPNLVFYREL